MHDTLDKRSGHMRHSEVQSMIMIAREHNRQPGAFDYNFPQTFYSTFPDIDQETYITIGSNQGKRVHADWSKSKNCHVVCQTTNMTDILQKRA